MSTLGSFGLLTELPIIFYAGLALLIVSAAIELADRHLSEWRMSLHAGALVAMLYGTAPLVYSQGRYSWLYKTIGVVQYVNAHGSLNRHIDIYQNWPGFFAVAAWFGKVAGVTSPLSYAKWAQLVFELAALPLLYLIYQALSLNVRQRWVAILLYSAANWIGQDYFSPQALGTLLSLGIMAMAMRWLYIRRSPRRRVKRSTATDAQRTGIDMLISLSREADPVPAQSAQDQPSSRAWRTVICGTVLLVYFVLTFTHELSPYMVAVQLGALAAARLLRPRWLPIALGAIALGYLLPRFVFINSHFHILDTIGNLFRNAAPPAYSHPDVSPSQQLIERSATALSLLMWGLAALGIWLRRHSGPTVLALALLAFSPIILLALQAYGNEGVLRVYLFSLPWDAALAAFAVVPSTASAVSSRRTRRVHRGFGAFPQLPKAVNFLRPPIALAIMVTLFLPAFFGDDTFNRMPTQEVVATTSFFRSARPGLVYTPLADAPMRDISRYNLFPVTNIFGNHRVAGTTPVASDIADIIANKSLRFTKGRKPVYIVIAPSMIAYNHAYRAIPSTDITVLLAALAHSTAWELVVDEAGTLIYELPPENSPSSGR